MIIIAIILNFNYNLNNMDFRQIEALKELVGLDKDDDDGGHIFGSAINPGNVAGKKKAEDEVARPNVKVEVKTFNRDAKGGATAESIK